MIVQLDLLSPSLRKTPPLQRSMLSSTEASIRFHSVVTNLSHQSRRALPRDKVASKVAVHEDCDLVNMFLSPKSQRRFGVSHQISRCTFQRDKVEFTRLALRIGLFLPFNTSLSWSFSRGVLTAFVFLLHLDSLMMSGACLKSNSMSKHCPV